MLGSFAAAAFLHALLLGSIAYHATTLSPAPTNGRAPVGSAPVRSIEVTLEAMRGIHAASSASADLPHRTAANTIALQQSRQRDLAVAFGPGSAAYAGDVAVAEGADTTSTAHGPSGAEAPRLAAAGAARATGQHPLSLESLGIGTSRPYLLTPESRPEPMTAQQRLDQSLAQGLVARDRLRGMGPHGAVLTALEQSSRVSGLPTQGEASFLVVLDAEGHLTLLDVVASNGPREPWARAARGARARLRGTRLRVPQGSRGLELEIRVTTRHQLPSGADPGVGYSVAGIPIKKGGGKHSGSVDILKPHLGIGKYKVPAHGTEVEVPTLEIGINPLEVNVDPADIGAEASRVVRAQVVREKVL
jgi:hypothetical protein